MNRINKKIKNRKKFTAVFVKLIYIVMILVTHSWKIPHVHCVSLMEYCMSWYTVPNTGNGYIFFYRDVFYELVREWEDCNSVAGWNIEEHMGDRIRYSNSIM